jgi:metalloprotease
MKLKSIIFSMLSVVLTCTTLNAQINLGEKALGALQNGVASLTFSNKDAAAISVEAVRKMDSVNKVAGPNDGYTLRLNRVFGKHKSENGLTLNYKVYLTKDVNAFATADGSVRVYSGLMDIMDDTQLLAVIGHEIGHVANEDTKDAIKNSLRKAAIVGAVSSQSNAVAKLSDSQLGQIGNAILESKFNRKQESDADTYSYNFLKRNGYNVNAEEAAFRILANMSGGNQSNFITEMLSSHPDPNTRAETAKARAQADGLYKPYTQKTINNSSSTTTKTVIRKKSTRRRK